jgi:hypothetical protein
MFGQGITLPRGKKVTFNTIPDLKDKEFLLEEDITIRINSNFSPIISGESSAALVTTAGFFKDKFGINIPVGFKQFGFQQWTGTDPLSVSFMIGIYMEEDAYEDVVKPAEILMSIPVPFLIGKNGGLGAPGVSLYQAVFDRNSNSNLVDIDIGSINIKECLITSVEPTISQEVDEDDYPIWIKLKIDAKTLWTANNEIIYNLFKPKIANQAKDSISTNNTSSNTKRTNFYGQPIG